MREPPAARCERRRRRIARGMRGPGRACRLRCPRCVCLYDANAHTLLASVSAVIDDRWIAEHLPDRLEDLLRLLHAKHRMLNPLQVLGVMYLFIFLLCFFLRLCFY